MRSRCSLHCYPGSESNLWLFCRVPSWLGGETFFFKLHYSIPEQAFCWYGYVSSSVMKRMLGARRPSSPHLNPGSSFPYLFLLQTLQTAVMSLSFFLLFPGFNFVQFLINRKLLLSSIWEFVHSDQWLLFLSHTVFALIRQVNSVY